MKRKKSSKMKRKEDDSLILNPSLGLIKTAVAMVKKTIVTVDKHGIEEWEEVAEFDTLVPRIASLSPLVDDLALSLYPPINWSESKSNANQLKQRRKQLHGLSSLGVR